MLEDNGAVRMPGGERRASQERGGGKMRGDELAHAVICHRVEGKYSMKGE